MADDDSYDYWNAKLAGGDPDPLEDRTKLPLGFWRLRDGRPLAVWRDMNSGRRIAVRGFEGQKHEMKPINMESMAEQGGFGTAITEEAYHAAMRAGHWPDTDPVVAEQTQRRDAPRRPGDNRPEVEDEHALLAEQIEAATKGASDYTKIEDDLTAKQAQSMRSRLLELSGEAVKKHKVEKDPHLTAGREVDNKWFPLRDTAKGVADVIRTALAQWENKKLAKANAARAEAERLQRQRDADAARIRAGEPTDGDIDRSQGILGNILGEPPEEAEAPPPVTAAPTQIRGGYGRPASVKTVQVATVFDQDAVYQFFKTNGIIVSALASLAQKATDAGVAVPGTKITEEAKVR